MIRDLKPIDGSKLDSPLLNREYRDIMGLFDNANDMVEKEAEDWTKLAEEGKITDPHFSKHEVVQKVYS